MNALRRFFLAFVCFAVFVAPIVAESQKVSGDASVGVVKAKKAKKKTHKKTAKKKKKDRKKKKKIKKAKKEIPSKYKSRQLSEGSDSHYRFDANGNPIDGGASKKPGPRPKDSSLESSGTKASCAGDASCSDKTSSEADAL